MILRSLRGTPLRRNSLIFDDNVATRKAAELGKKAPLTKGEQSPEALGRATATD
jgi:hypothetical protein